MLVLPSFIPLGAFLFSRLKTDIHLAIGLDCCNWGVIHFLPIPLYILLHPHRLSEYYTISPAAQDKYTTQQWRKPKSGSHASAVTGSASPDKHGVHTEQFINPHTDQLETKRQYGLVRHSLLGLLLIPRPRPSSLPLAPLRLLKLPRPKLSALPPRRRRR